MGDGDVTMYIEFDGTRGLSETGSEVACDSVHVKDWLACLLGSFGKEKAMERWTPLAVDTVMVMAFVEHIKCSIKAIKIQVAP